MNLAWLAAVLQPHDVARHPNFSERPAALSAVERLAGAVIGGDWLLAFHDEEVQEPAHQSNEFGLVALAEGTLRSDSIAASVSTLAQRLCDGDAEDPALAAALALMVCCAAVELDDYGTCFTVLEVALARLGDKDDDDGRLVRAAVMQQRALRLRDSGSPYIESALAAGQAALATDSSRCTSFETSRGVAWDSRTTCDEMRAALIDAAAASLPAEQDALAQEVGLPSWQTRVQSPATRFFQRTTSMRAAAYAGYVRQVFDRGYRTGGWTVGGHGPPDLFHAALATELLGHPAATNHRQELALLRLVQPYPELAQDRDVIRLLRHGSDRADLDLVLRRFRMAGPLTAISADARQILSARTSAPELLRSVELQVLQVAADLLAPSEARQGLDAVQVVIATGDPRGLPGEWQLLVLRKEQAWRAAAALANACDAQTEAADLLLSEASGVVDDQLADQSVASAIHVLEWKSVASPAAARWAAWASEHATTFPVTAESLQDLLNLPAPLAEPATALESIVSSLNASIRGGPAPDPSAEATEAVRQSLVQVMSQAARGISHFGGLEPADIAAGMVVVAGATDLWPDLTALLVDPLVRKSHKSSAFERLARAKSLAIPDEHAISFRRDASALLRPDDDQFESRGPSPHPPALRFLAVHRLLPDPEVMDLIAALAGSHDPIARAEAAKTVATVAAASPHVDLLVMALSLAHDDDVAARAHAGRALASLSSLSSPLASAATRRLIDLLGQDGLMAPTLLLSALTELGGSLPPAIREQVAMLRMEHPSRQVRAAAVAALEANVGNIHPL